MEETSFISSSAQAAVPFLTKWQAPSNIALIKYWGKTEPQIPKNPSLSFTLSSSVTITEVDFTPSPSGAFQFEFYFEGKLKPDFHPKLNSFFERISPFIPWIRDYALKISSQNSFPHSSGIASSASAMAALSLCLMDRERKLDATVSDETFFQKASFLARLGSGSAARSIQGPVTLWGKNTIQSSASNLYATPFGTDLHPVFTSYQDTILLVDKGSKPVSSSQGHQLMYNHPFAEQRFVQATTHLTDLVSLMKSGDLEGFIRIVETEALSLHAMMMTSNPYFILMQPNTLAIIQKVWDFRAATKIPLCFTLDAGANVHLLYPEANKEAIRIFIASELAVHCEGGQYLFDQVGSGAKKV
ncbi:MAG: diphosphomevalonate decarboxylase [Flavobacteriaceae bacterium]